MRLLILPISTRRSLIFAHRLSKDPPATVSLLDRGVARAGALWAGWERADGGWRARVVGWGNTLFARIPFQEWSLKRVPRRKGRGGDGRSMDDTSRAPRASVVYPRDLLRAPAVRQEVWALGERGGFHKRRLAWSVAGMPLTAPFMAIPVVPNLPFFYLAFRAWSHWKALLGARHLEYLVQHQLLAIDSSRQLRKIYDAPPLTEHSMRRLREFVKGEPTSNDRRAAVLTAAGPRRMRTMDARPEELPSEEPQPSERMVAGEQTAQLVSLYYDLPQLEAEMDRARAQVQRLIAKEHAEAVEKATREDRKNSDKKPPTKS